MREIKFRAWDGDSMFFPTQITFPGGEGWDVDKGRGVSIEAQPHITLMQYTGLTDRNGVDIYEGDLYRLPFSGRVVEIKFRKGNFFHSEAGYRLADGGEVIGNIYEHPHLLKANSKGGDSGE